MKSAKWAGLLGIVLTAGIAAGAEEPSPFAEGERLVAASPGAGAELPLAAGETAVDLEASPGGGEVALLVAGKGGEGARVVLWTPGGGSSTVWKASAGSSPKSVTWHPESRVLFVLAAEGDEHRILRLEPSGAEWKARAIHRTTATLRRLVVGPRPFLAELKGEPKPVTARRYRLFFGEGAVGGRWSIRSVTELGEAEYRVLGPGEGPLKGDRDGGEGNPPPGQDDRKVTSALPLSFHPGGHFLIWEDERRGFHVKPYEGMWWGPSRPLAGEAITGGTITALPNGLGLLRWKGDAPGAVAWLRGGKEKVPLATAWTFASTPSLMPDGKGLVGVTRTAGGPSVVRYVPVSMPLADVANAWMFVTGGDDLALLEGKGGLFRRLGGEQLYELYDSELYVCGGYSYTTPTRPYLVTTDLFWEVWAAAYEGLFLVRERETAVPAFWTFVDAAADEMSKTSPASPWAKLLANARALRPGAPAAAPGLASADEVRRIRAHAERASSSATGRPFDFRELTPRGHYAGRPALASYFAAMRYLTAAGAAVEDAGPLTHLSGPVKAKALAWIGAYEPFLAPSRSPEALRAGHAAAAWVREPGKSPVLFPLSWGFDNETLDATVFHPDRPVAERVEGRSGPRLVPSGLDVAAAFGSRLARTLLASEMETYPPLRTALDALAARRPKAGPSLYERWLEALGTQWADGPLSSVPAATRPLWGAKRLQTGLASWATLRHATVLVNERSVAECGEGGFEELVMRPPRGAVEGDPNSFEAIASLFDAAAALVRTSGGLGGKLPEDDPNGDREREPLKQGLVKRLAKAAEEARAFGRMAERQRKEEPLTASDYERILHVGRAAEHDFLVFKSLASETLALSRPDPMPKVADVAGGGAVPLLHAAVGAPLEWDLVVPFFGRRQVVKGSAYAYHEMVTAAPTTDEEWRKRAATTPLPPWVEPFVARGLLPCPPASPF